MSEIDSLRDQVTALEKWTSNELTYLKARIALLEDYRKTPPLLEQKDEPCTT